MIGTGICLGNHSHQDIRDTSNCTPEPSQTAWLVPMELYDEFVHQVTSFASRNGIKNMAAAVSKIIEIAREDAEEE